MPPTGPPDLPSPAALPALLAISARPQTMLLVEDSRFAAEVVRLICRRAGIRLRRAETLEAARQHLRAYQPELALIDLGLPDGSGLGLIAELDALEPRRPRIVGTSGESGLEQAALAAGADAFCAKPLDLTGQLDVILGATPPPGRFLRRDAECTSGAGNGRDVTADPMALHDDLRRAHLLLMEGRRVCYAGQFVGGIARSLNDAGLIAAAGQAERSGRRRPLLAALHARMQAGPAI